MTSIAIESYKGGQGATTVAVVLALQLSEHGPVRLCADRSEAAAVHGGALVPFGNLEVVDGRSPDDQLTVIDANGADADMRLVVVRNCFLALRATLSAPIQGIDGIIAMLEEGRSFGRADIEDSLGYPVVAAVDLTHGAARAIDAGILPRDLRRRGWKQLDPVVDTILAERAAR